MKTLCGGVAGKEGRTRGKLSTELWEDLIVGTTLCGGGCGDLRTRGS